MEYSQGTEAEVTTEDGEEAVEEGGWPADFGEDEDDDLANDKQAVCDGPECASGLIRDCSRTITR